MNNSRNLILAVVLSALLLFGYVARSVYLFDLEVTLYGAVGFAMLAPALGLGRDAVHDGILSVRRGSTLEELRALVDGLPVKAVRVFPSALCTLPA